MPEPPAGVARRPISEDIGEMITRTIAHVLRLSRQCSRPVDGLRFCPPLSVQRRCPHAGDACNHRQGYERAIRQADIPDLVITPIQPHARQREPHAAPLRIPADPRDRQGVHELPTEAGNPVTARRSGRHARSAPRGGWPLRRLVQPPYAGTS